MARYDDLAEFCSCAETLVNGQRIVPPLQHNCEYVKLRNALMDRATREAHRRHAFKSYEFARAFSVAMDDFIRRAWSMATKAGHIEPGPDRNRSFRDALVKLAWERS